MKRTPKRKETLAERRIREARERGLFDGLAGTGEPIADLHVQRPEGWWANRLLKTERSKLKRSNLDQLVQSSMAQIWRLPSEVEVRKRVVELNAQIRDYNVVTNLDARELLDSAEVVATWRRLGLGGT